MQDAGKPFEQIATPLEQKTPPELEDDEPLELEEDEELDPTYPLELDELKQGAYSLICFEKPPVI